VRVLREGGVRKNRAEPIAALAVAPTGAGRQRRRHVRRSHPLRPSSAAIQRVPRILEASNSRSPGVAFLAGRCAGLLVAQGNARAVHALRALRATPVAEREIQRAAASDATGTVLTATSAAGRSKSLSERRGGAAGARAPGRLPASDTGAARRRPAPTTARVACGAPVRSAPARV
jgi:hypothetical protein